MKFTLRIKKNGTFRYILNNGKYVSGKYLNVHVTQNNSKKYKDKNFIGICISKKNGNSVERNKMKRWVREVYKNNESIIKKNLNFIFLYKKTTTYEKLDFYKIEEDINNCFRKLDVYEIN